MRFSRARLAAVPALAIAPTGGAAMAATASPAPSAAKAAAETARAVRDPDTGTAQPRGRLRLPGQAPDTAGEFRAHLRR